MESAPFLLLLLLLNPIDPTEDVGKEEVLRHLEFFVTTVQTRRKNACNKSTALMVAYKGVQKLSESLPWLFNFDDIEQSVGHRDDHSPKPYRAAQEYERRLVVLTPY
jgi:hypothetical protein